VAGEGQQPDLTGLVQLGESISNLVNNIGSWKAWLNFLTGGILGGLFGSGDQCPRKLAATQEVAARMQGIARELDRELIALRGGFQYVNRELQSCASGSAYRQQEVDAARKELAYKDLELRSCQGTAADRGTKLDACRQQGEALKYQILQMTSQCNDAINSWRQSYNRDVTALRGQIQQLQQAYARDVGRLQQQFQQCSSQQGGDVQTLNTLRAQYANLANQLTVARATINELQPLRAQVTAEHQMVQQLRGQLGDERQKFEQQRAQEGQQNQQLRDQLQRVGQYLTVEKGYVGELRGELAFWQEQTRQARAKTCPPPPPEKKCPPPCMVHGQPGVCEGTCVLPKPGAGKGTLAGLFTWNGSIPEGKVLGWIYSPGPVVVERGCPGCTATLGTAPTRSFMLDLSYARGRDQPQPWGSIQFAAGSTEGRFVTDGLRLPIEFTNWTIFLSSSGADATAANLKVHLAGIFTKLGETPRVLH